MANVIIGHTTDCSARIWLRGGRRQTRVLVRLHNPGDLEEKHSETVRLPRSRDRIACVDFNGLKAQTPYMVEARFVYAPWRSIRELPDECALGRFRTAANGAAQPSQLMFLFGSCNLTNIKVNNVLGLVVGVIGSYVLAEALRRDCTPPERDFFILAGIKWALRLAARIGAWCVYKVTKYRQPAPPWIVSPFLRLATLFDTCDVTTFQGSHRPSVGTLVTGERSAATAIVAFAVDAESRAQQRRAGGRKSPAVEAAEEERLMLVPTNERQFQVGECLVWGEANKQGEYARSARVKSAAKRKPTVQPELMLHLGDQIYFDFPTRDPRPTLRNYRGSYREAWSEDVVAAHFLAQCRQYMTLDDHEIFNNFATDALAPRPALGAAGYAGPALQAYNEYVHVRHPQAAAVPEDTCPECNRPLGAGRHFYYSFAHGDLAHFFVMDTRTERYGGGLLGEPGRMISCCQLETLKRWLHAHREHLVFIVSSVPFVPEVHATADEVPSTAKRQSFSLDKWCAPVFAAQREAIVRHICELGLRRVVFLTGDMHCCYHAVMKVRLVNEPTECITIHELAAGPIYQLRLARADHFYELYRGAFNKDDQRLRYVSRIQHFYGLANAVMAVTVARSANSSAARDTEVLWDVIPTVGQPHPASRARGEGAAGFVRVRGRAEELGQHEAPLDPAEPVMRGKISFAD